MGQLPLFDTPLWSVTDLTRYVRDIFESDPALQDIWVQGEISNLSRPSSGHMYFTLKDSASSLKCVVWRNSAIRLAFLPGDGQAVDVHGSLNIYEAAGQYQLYADTIRPRGEGVLFQEFLRLKARLEAQGLFATERKRPVPAWPRRIGIITSPTGAALRDIINTLQRRFPLAEIILAPTAVQGEEAPAGIVSALESLNRMATPDVILLARGGGTIEDLWAFNDEHVAHAIAASKAPVITGVGHETDFTIADFVSDLRAPTPTAAAELATPNRSDLQADLVESKLHLERAINLLLANQKQELSTLRNRLSYISPISRIRSDRQRLDEFSRRAGFSLEHSVQIFRALLNGLTASLNSLSPLSILGRGYALVSTPDGHLVSSVAHVNPGDEVNVKLSDGQMNARVQQVSRKNG